jgi:predicted metal-dependent phosphoesterase TrpH
LQICADLHTHSNASDGDLSPEVLVAQAASIGLAAIALTDHDTLSGVPHALNSRRNQAIQVIAGVEISAEYEPGTLHLLGYFPAYPDGLELALNEVQAARKKRIPKVIEKLNALGCILTEEDVMTEAGEAQIGRPHIAKALLKKGYVRSFDEAFDEYLGKGKKAYVPKEKMTGEKAISLIIRYGGLPVLAHPYTLSLSTKEMEAFIIGLKEAGLAGVEAYYPDHTPEQTARYASLASSLGLLVTGGTDFHGPYRNAFSLGDYGLDKERLTIFLKGLNA